jgi:4-amino-4-deoxy-L-arabinose transferase-like glycosyltransferase
MFSKINGDRSYLAYVALALVLAALSLAVHMDVTMPSGVHETRVLETGREMLERDNWVLPRFSGVVRLQKPPLPYWASALAFKLAGEPSLAAARFMVGLFGLLMLVSTGLIALAVFNRQTALLVLPVMASSLLFSIEFSKATTDPFLAALVTAAIAGFAWAFRRSGRLGAIYLCLAYLATSLALLAKGPIALVFVAIGAIFVRPRTLDNASRAWHWHAVGVLLSFLPILVWAFLVMQQIPDAFSIWRYEVLGRVTGEVEELRGRWFYLPAILAAIGPLSLPFLAGLVRGIFQRERMILWFASGLLFLMLLSSRKEAYLLPLMTPSALIIAQYLARLDEYRESRYIAWIQLLANLLLIAALLGAAFAWRYQLSWLAVGVGLLLLAAAALLLRDLYLAKPSVASLVITGVLITAFYNGVMRAAVPEDMTTYNLSRYLNAHVPRDVTLYQQGGLDPRLAFHINRLPVQIDDVRSANAQSPAWLLTHAPLPEATRLGWSEVFQTEQKKNGQGYFLYRR